MCVIKKGLFALSAIVMLSGCGLKERLVTDTGSGKSNMIAREDYLMVPTEQKTADDQYRLLTLEEGTFEEEILDQTMNRMLSLNDIPSVRLQVKEEQMRMGEYVADHMSKVEKGDVIARVYVEKDAIALEEAQIALQRLQERFTQAQSDADWELQEMEEARLYIYDSYDQRIADIRLRQRQMDWENERYHYEENIADAAKRLKELQEVGEVYEVKADRAGYVFYSARYVEGFILHYNDYICHIIDPDKIYVFTDSQSAQMSFGKQVEFDSRQGKMTGQVVNGGQLALYGNLDTGRTVFRLYPDGSESLVNLNNLTSVTMNAELKRVEHVVLVPVQAVTVENDSYYVTVRREDGSLVKTAFLPGGSNLNEYWVLEGLSAGMQIVYQ